LTTSRRSTGPFFAVSELEEFHSSLAHGCRAWYADLREETRAIIRHIRECLVAARNFDRVIALIDSSVQAIDSSNALLASLRTMHELVDDVDVHIARAGDTLIGDVVVSALREQAKKSAA
jgi:hypothetical protein